MSDARDVRGMVVPVPTPFLDDGELDEPVFAALVDHYVQRRAHALYLFGSYGQGAAMETAQRKRGAEIALGVVAGRVPVVVEVGSVDPYRSRDLGTHARDLGATAISMVGPYYYADRSPEDVIQQFAMVDEVVELPIMLANNRAYQGYPIPVDLVARIRDTVPRLFAVHPAHVGMTDLLAYVAKLGPDFTVLPSPDLLFPGMLVGQAGTVSPPLSLVVEVGVAFVDAIDRGDTHEALRIHLAILRYLQRLAAVQRWYRAGYRVGLRHLGFDVKQFPRWPTAEIPIDVEREFHLAIDELQASCFEATTTLDNRAS